MFDADAAVHAAYAPGGDLSTMSRQDATGSNPQQEDSDELDGDNAAWVTMRVDHKTLPKVGGVIVPGWENRYAAM